MGMKSILSVRCISRTTSAPASPAPMIKALLDLPSRPTGDCSASIRSAKREPPIKTSESSQSIPNAERGIPGCTKPALIKVNIRPETATEAVVTAVAINFNSLMLA